MPDLTGRDPDKVRLARLQKELQFVWSNFIDLEKEYLNLVLRFMEYRPRLDWKLHLTGQGNLN